MMHKSYIRQPGGEDLACSCSCACFLAETRRALETRALLGLKTASGREIRGTSDRHRGDPCTGSPQKGGDPGTHSHPATLPLYAPRVPTQILLIVDESDVPAPSCRFLF